MRGEEDPEPSRVERAGRFVWAVGKRFYDDDCTLWASSLTYYSLLSIVPLLAIVFAFAKALGGVEERIDELVSYFTIDAQLTHLVVDFVRQARVGALTGLSTGLLLYTAITLLGSIENALNHIWRVHRGRDFMRRVADYLSVFLVSPFLMVAALGVTSTVQEQVALQWLLRNEYVGEAVARLLQGVPVFFNMMAVAFLLSIMPNRAPHLRSTLPAAALGGVGLQLVQATYVKFQFSAASWELLYGALAQIPVMMLWIYASWAVVLLAAEFAAVVEFGVDDQRQVARVAPWATALQILLRAAESFRAAGGPVDPGRLAREMRVPRSVVEAVVERLDEKGFVSPTGGEGHIILAREPAGIDLGMIVRLFDGTSAPEECDARVSAALARAETDRHAGLRQTTLADLLETPAPGDADPTRH